MDGRRQPRIAPHLAHEIGERDVELLDEPAVKELERADNREIVRLGQGS
jgi:hypothetical protein